MGSLLSTISGHFAKTIILGTLFPVVIMSTLSVFFVGPLIQPTADLQTQMRRIAAGEDKWAVVTLTFAVVVLTGLLRNLNSPIIRFYEGYSWKASFIGGFFTQQKQKRLAEARSLQRVLLGQYRELSNRNPNNPLLATMEKQQTKLALYLGSEFPDREDLVLPTRFGNIIRCFERYSQLAYGMEAIILWPRLIAKIDGGFAAAIDDAKISLDFMLHCSFLSAIIAFGIPATRLISSGPLTWPSVAPWLRAAAVFAASAFIFYQFSIERAKAWGVQVNAAFDLYRLDLLKSLGYQQKPSGFREEKALWLRISEQLVFADSKELKTQLPYGDPLTKVVASPVGIRLTVEREIKGIHVKSIRVELRVKNHDAQRPARKVRLFESVPDGYMLFFHSVQAPATVSVSSLRPLEFYCKAIPAGTEVILTYGIRQSESQK